MLLALSDQCRLRMQACNLPGIFVRAGSQFDTSEPATFLPPSETAGGPLAAVADLHGGHSQYSTNQG